MISGSITWVKVNDTNLPYPKIHIDFSSCDWNSTEILRKKGHIDSSPIPILYGLISFLTHKPSFILMDTPILIAFFVEVKPETNSTYLQMRSWNSETWTRERPVEKYGDSLETRLHFNT